MKLLELKLNNFRQFYGEQSMEFSRDDKNITVILGENGNGKTGIFRAIIFCLFNEKELPKDKLDKGTSSNSIHLVNLNVLKENIGMPVEALVELVFENKGKKYVLERKIYDMFEKNGNILSSIEVEVKLTISAQGGNVEDVITKQSEVSVKINNIISDRVKDLFFFDGDKIEALSTTNTSSRQEIKNGIMKLLQIDSVKKAVEITDKLKNEQRKKITSNANTKLQSEEKELEKIKEKAVDLKDSLDHQKSELEKVRETIVKLELEQQENEPIKEMFKQRANIIDSKNKTTTILSNIRGNIQELLSKDGHSLLIEDTLLRSKNFIEQEEKEKGFHSGITLDLIEHIIDSNECICGTKFTSNDAMYEKLIDIKRKYGKMQLSDFIREFKRNVNNSLQFDKDVDVNIQEYVKNYSDQLEDIEKLGRQLDDIEKQKNEFSKTEDKLQGIENSLQKCKIDASDTNRRVGGLERDVEISNQLIIMKEAEIKKLRNDDEKLKKDNSVYQYYERLNNIFSEIQDSYSSKMRSRLSSEATIIFNKLISEKDKRVISQISINEQYEIKAKGWNDISIFQDISSGQKQMLSLSFVSALASVAAGSENSIINMPLFMDTPFAKLDGANRDSLITEMPYLTSQWVLLVTDTEFTRSEVKKMKETNRWGKFYRLDKISDGYTKIKLVNNINEFVANR
ncbi:AAA family ATPase [Clostridium sp. FP2]|uniref:AAA family ATPase n=1 Tax=Clostridium sp. FP2 TaxID=2724481 RepID=UPI0013E9038F|nr:AAA family ATPase [Clostridium sp. FP2]MBZ9625593.1 AAA family ATPase [Clostridium sp. FP2]